MIYKLKKFENYFTSSLAEEPEDENDDRKITAETLKKLDELKHFIKVNKSDHLNTIFNKLIENWEQIKFKNQKQSDIYWYCLLVWYEKKILR